MHVSHSGKVYLLDLPSVDVCMGKGLVTGIVNMNFALHLAEEVLPDLLARLDGQIVVLEWDVDTRLEGFVEGGHPVAGEEEDAFVVLQDSQKDTMWRQSQVMSASLLRTYLTKLLRSMS